MTYFGQSRYMKIVTLAYKDLNDFKNESELTEFIETVTDDHMALLSNLTFVALVGISDPIRPEAYNSV